MVDELLSAPYTVRVIVRPTVLRGVPGNTSVHG